VFFFFSSTKKGLSNQKRHRFWLFCANQKNPTKNTIHVNFGNMDDCIPFNFFDDDGTIKIQKYEACMEDQDEEDERLFHKFSNSSDEDLDKPKQLKLKKTRRTKGRWSI